MRELVVEELKKKTAVLLVGRAAEKIVFNHLSTGATDDLDKATDIAWAAATRYGMAEGVGNVVYEKPTHAFLSEFVVQARARNYSDETADRIDRAVRNMVQAAFESAMTILTANEELLRQSAMLLLEKETLNDGELRTIISRVQDPQDRRPNGLATAGV